MTCKIYLAGPDVFLPNAREIGRRKCELCQERGVEGLFPLDQDAGAEATAASIFQANHALMRRADAGLFNLTPFRGPSADAGTVFELGLMFALGKPVFGYTSTSASYTDRVDAAFGPAVERDARRYDRNGHLIESFGLTDNLMIDEAVRKACGDIAVVGENGEEALAAMRAFEACLEMLCA
ncbi:MAG: nucleoside 2-deoxyribosyltransferase [Alphaproteobacteria bacterium]|nr:nucleoside 2-deoxyribosyltransferase [Alphaproteobacteria bacterium]